MTSNLRKTLDRAITFAQVSADFLTVFLVYLAAYGFYTEALARSSPQSLPEFLLISLAAGLIYVLILDRVGLYKREISLLNVKELKGVFSAGLYAAGAMLSLSFYIRYTSFSRITLTAAMIAAPVALYIQRQLFYNLHTTFHRRGWSKTRVLVYGAGKIGVHLAKRMFESPALGLLPIGFLDDDKAKHHTTLKWRGIGPTEGVEILGGEEVLERVKKLGVELIVIALPTAKFERNQALVNHCLESGLQYFIVPNSYEKIIHNVELFEIGGIPVLRHRERDPGVLYRVVKRLTDFVVSAALMILLSPLVLCIWVAMRLDTPGPLIFKQKRVGLNGKQFSLYKFRSMYVTAEKYAVTPNHSDDPRITRFGKWLRRSSLDELPQLYNVLRGDMSLVGPRPEMPFIANEYTELERKRLEVKPGITGVWQISAVRGEPIHHNMEYDLFYIDNQSLLLDLAILVKTGLSVIRGIGAF